MRIHLVHSSIFALVMAFGLHGTAVAQGAGPDPVKSEAGVISSPAAPAVTDPESTVGLAPADQPTNNTHENIAGQKVPSAQNDAAAHNPSVAEHDKQPTITHTFNFTKEQKRTIMDALAQEKGAALNPDFSIKESVLLPSSIELKPVPERIGQEMPWVKPYKYVKIGDKILLVDNNLPFVAAVIE